VIIMAPLSTSRRFIPIAWLVGAALWATPAMAQPGPVQFFDGTVRIAGEVTLTAGARDEDAFFNYTDYERNALRGIRIAGTALWQPRPRMALVAEVRTDDFSRVSGSAWYLRVRPWTSIPLDLQAGRIPPVFGAYGRQVYAADRLLIGSPLAYQYLTSLRPDAIPADAGDLLRMRGRGWLSSFPVGDTTADAGVPLISGFRWDTGVQVRWQAGPLEAAAAITQGTLASPRVVDDNDRPQLSGRMAMRFGPGTRAGVSGARGRFLSDDLPGGGRPGGTQTSVGADAEYSRGRFLVRGEAVWTRWTIPYITPPPEGDAISASGAWIEGRYRITPRLYVAARLDRLAFSHVTGRSPFERRDTWDADVRRVEAGAGYSLLRNLGVRAVVQLNERDGGRVTERTYVSSQVSWWF
jgi:hypothetical protein